MAGGETPVSWYMIEPGWEIVDRDGEPVGRVEEVLGDSNHDIFDGLALAPSFLGKSHYVPAEEVAQITEGRVQLALSRQAVEQLSEYVRPATPPSEPQQARAVDPSPPAAAAAPPGREPLLRRLFSRIRAWLGV